MKNILHKISHFLKWNKGVVISEIRDDGCWMGWKCSGCGEEKNWFNAEKMIDNELKK